MAGNRTSLALQVPQQYDRGTLARILGLQDRENSRISAFGGTVTWDPASIADGDSESKAVVVPGVVANVLASVRVFAPYSLQGMIVGGYVSADDEVTLVLNNNTGFAVNLGSGTFGVLVENFVLT